ncbi:MAG TPA: hypothetical protein VII53_01570 [Solirubrobacteraceae bacterium]
MVSPLDKQQHDALTIIQPPRISVSPEGDAIEWASQGDYAGAQNYQVHSADPSNPYVARRLTSGWATSSAYPPPSLIEEPFIGFTASGVFSPDLSSESVCGTAHLTGTEEGPTIRCALRNPEGSWTGTPEYTDLTGANFAHGQEVGASRSVGDVVFYSERGHPFLSQDTSPVEGCGSVEGHCGGIYEETGTGTDSPGLQLVNVDSGGNMIGPENENAIGALPSEPSGSNYQAVSSDGSKVFFTAIPSGGVPTLYARVNGSETIAISQPPPSQCTGACAGAPPARAIYQGASASGARVFFTTTQPLVNGDTDEGNDLYEYDFTAAAEHRLVQVSGGGLGDLTPGAGAEVRGVVAVSEDGSHIYFVADGVLTSIPNALGQQASLGANNLYGYDAETGETRYIASLSEADRELWGFSLSVSGTSGQADLRLAQSTADGRYLVFDSFAKLITAGSEADTSGARQVYRYDFATGALVRVSVGHNGFADNGNVPGFNAVIGPVLGSDSQETEGASPSVNDSNRSISENGDTIAFVTAAQLQSTDIAGGANKSCTAGIIDVDGAGCEVYAWHECSQADCGNGQSGEVSMISDGQDPAGSVYAGMSATGSDIFFQTRTRLVAQDTDSLGDIYDARIDGGFAAPTPEPSCSGEACQGTQSSSPTFGTPGSQSFTGGGNQTAPPFKEVLEPETKPKSKPLTNAQRLAKALKQCRRDRAKARRVACEKASRKRLGPKPKAKGKK